MPDDRKPPRRKTDPYGIDLSGDRRDKLVSKHEPLQLSAPHAIDDEQTGSHNVWEKYQRAKNHSAMLKLHAEKIDTIREDVTELKVDAAHKTGQLNTLLSETSYQTRVLADIAKMQAQSATKRADTDAELEAHRIKWWRRSGSRCWRPHWPRSGPPSQ